VRTSSAFASGSAIIRRHGAGSQRLMLLTSSGGGASLGFELPLCFGGAFQPR
jgi:hypothetical protein